jgi:hypothetical protein
MNGYRWNPVLNTRSESHLDICWNSVWNYAFSQLSIQAHWLKAIVLSLFLLNLKALGDRTAIYNRNRGGKNSFRF